MLMQGDPVTHAALEGALTVVGYNSRREVVVSTREGDTVTVPESELRRFVPEPAPKPERVLEIDPELAHRQVGVYLALDKAIPRMEVDWRGHHLRGVLRAKRGVGEHFVFPTTLAQVEDHEAIVAAFNAGVPLDRWIALDANDHTCNYCLDHTFETNGIVIRPVNECPHPDGFVSEATLNVPSGKIIISDDLRRFCPIADNFDLNTVKGCHERFLKFAQEGMIIGQVGNSCPNVYKSRGGYEIGLKLRKKVLAHITTDLWAYSMMDYEDCRARAKALGVEAALLKKIKIGYASVLDVKPGVYQVQHLNKLWLPNDKGVFASFRWISKPEPVVDWYEKASKFMVTAGLAVQADAGFWSRVCPDEKESFEDACFHWLGYYFRGCIPRRDWSFQGHPRRFHPADLVGLEDRPIPRLRKRSEWDLDGIETVVSRNAKTWGGDTPLNPSFANAALKLLESVISFGVLKTDYKYPDPIDMWNRAIHLYAGVLNRYPDADYDLRDFTQWLQDEEAVQAWGQGLFAKVKA